MVSVEDVIEPSTNSAPPDPYIPIDPEADADEALKTLRQFVLEDIGPDAPPVDTWHGLDAYIEELCAYGVDKLTREPDDLNATCLRLKNDLEEVSCGNYRALIESFECAGAVRDGVADVRSRLDELVVSLPKLADATRQFSANVNEKQRERERRLRAITEYRAISDILEMPRLMRTLIAAELYDEALELRENAVRLASMHPDEKLICDVCAEMDILTQQMILRLLVLLRNTVQLPMCLRVVGFLRRLGVFSEFKLRMLFLQSRGEWMRSGIEASSASTQQAHLVNLSDSTRAMVFEIITQYRAVFNDDLGDDDDDEFIESMNGGGEVPFSHSSAILFDWTSSCVCDYLERLEAGIKDIRDGAALNTVLQQAMYCGQSLGRVGADFRSSLPPLFEDAVLRIYNSHLNAALRQFEMMIEDNRWAPVGSSALRKERGQSFLSLESSPAKGTTPEEKAHEIANDQYEPPVGVLDSPPLAVFLNGILAALNELRLCAPVSLGLRLGKTLQQTLISAGEYMGAVGGPGGAFLKRSDRQHFVGMSASLRDLCVQHAARCLDHCMNRNGLVNVEEVQAALTEIFGETLTPVLLSKETVARLNGTAALHDRMEPIEAELEGNGVERSAVSAHETNDAHNDTKEQSAEGNIHDKDPGVPESNIAEETSAQETMMGDGEEDGPSSNPDPTGKGVGSNLIL